MLHIMTDTGADFTLDRQEELGIFIRPIHISFEGEDVPQTTDEDITAFFDRLEKEKNLPTTSRLSPGELLFDFKQILDQIGPDDQLLYIALSSKLSGTCEMAFKAKEELQDQRLFVFDSLNATYGQTMEVFRAIEKRDEGCDATEVMRDLQTFRKHALIQVMLDTLANLKKGGRIPGPLAAFGDALSIKPNVTETSWGYVELVNFSRGRKACLNKQMETFENNHRVEKYKPVVLYTSDKGMAEDYQEEIYNRLHIETDLMRMGAVVGTHIGPRSVGLCGIIRDEIENVFFPASRKWRK